MGSPAGFATAGLRFTPSLGVRMKRERESFGMRTTKGHAWFCGCSIARRAGGGRAAVRGLDWQTRLAGKALPLLGHRNWIHDRGFPRYPLQSSSGVGKRLKRNTDQMEVIRQVFEHNQCAPST